MVFGISDTGTKYPYNPSHILPAVFAALIGISFLWHTWQNFHYRFWKVTFFMFWGGIVFTAGWIVRIFSSYDPTNTNLYIAQACLIAAGPPIYAAAEYNILGRLMTYLPMHAALHPRRVVYFFVYLGVLVESLTAAGAARQAAARGDESKMKSGAMLLAIASVLQSVVELVFIAMVGVIHRRCARAKMMARNVRVVCIMLYCTSILILIRGIFRAIENFATVGVLNSDICNGLCRAVIRNEWYIYILEVAPMLLYTYGLNIFHPGRYLPHDPKIYLDFDKQERCGPGWVYKGSTWMTFIDPFDFLGLSEKFWLNGDKYPIVDSGAFTDGTTTNVRNKTRYGN